MTTTQHLLLVEDEPTLRELLSARLQLAGFHVVPAETGAQALTAVRERHPDLIVLDVMLPDIDGFEVARRLREQPTHGLAHPPILFLTARDAAEDRISGLRAAGGRVRLRHQAVQSGGTRPAYPGGATAHQRPPGEAPVLGDEARLRQVTSNLVGNAIAHTPPGTPVRIGVGTQDGQAVLELSDQGPGMTDDQAARVFDRFYRADTARGRTETGRTETGGAGLGLSIVHSLVSAHHGRVEVHTAPGRGATFRVLLPLHTDTLINNSER